MKRMRVQLTRDEVAEALREAMANDSSAKELIDFTMGFASAYYVYNGATLEEWLRNCAAAYNHSRTQGIAMGLVDAPD